MLSAVDEQTETHTSPGEERLRTPPTPGVVRVFSRGAAQTVVTRWDGQELTVGRAAQCSLAVEDVELSRQHVRMRWDGSAWTLVDLQSRNGTYVDGRRLEGEVRVAQPTVVRAGATVFLVEPDVSRFLTGTVVVNDRVTGPAMHKVLGAIGRAAQAGATLLIVGETGTGKEHAARTFHAAGRPRGPLETVNCAAIPESLAESILFGARKGAYSGAQELPGHFAAADKGVLFLDEIGTLNPDIQAKVLRAIEHKTIQPLGAATPRKVDVLICGATNEDLAAAIDRGEFRRDLYARLAQEVVVLPPLHERREEIPHLIRLAVPSETLPGLRISAGFVEACLLRAWPTNVRGLLAAVGRAARHAVAEGADEIVAADLPPELAVGSLPPAVPFTTNPPSATPNPPERVQVPTSEELKLEAFRVAYLKHQGNADAAAKELGIGRSTAYRWLERIRAR